MLTITPKIIKKGLLLPLLCYSMICFSQKGHSSQTIHNEKGGVEFLRSENGHIFFQVGLNNIPAKGCLIRITDQSGEIIYENRIHESAYSRVFKFPDYNMSKINFDISGKKYRLNRSFDLRYKVETKLEVVKLQ
jgi:hypothetical protein